MQKHKKMRIWHVMEQNKAVQTSNLEADGLKTPQTKLQRGLMHTPGSASGMKRYKTCLDYLLPFNVTQFYIRSST